MNLLPNLINSHSTPWRRKLKVSLCPPGFSFLIDQFSPSETRAEIMGGTEVHVELGSTLNLTCVVRNTREKPHYLLWYHSNQVGQQS